VAYKQIKTKSSPPDDDVVMVDGPTSGNEPMITSGPDDIAFVDHPPILKRTNTARKSGIFGSLFGATKFSSKDEYRPKSSRDRDLTDADDALPIRTRDKSTKRKSTTRGLDEGFQSTEAAETDADADARRIERRRKRDEKEAAARDAEEADQKASEARRKDRREREKADLEARRVKARDRARKEQEEEDARREERRARRKEKDVGNDGEPEISAASAARKEERRRLRAELEAAEMGAKSGNDTRRKSYAPEPEDDRRRRRDEGRSSKRDKEREPRISTSKSKSSRRKSTALMDEYHESRNGGGSVPIPPNKTSSWVDSQADDPPEIPPVVETILDGSGERPRRADGAGDGDRRDRKSRRKAPTTERSGGSDERRSGGRRRGDTNGTGTAGEGGDYEYQNQNDMGYGPLRSGVDGRPVMQSKRQSFLGKFF
jgi:hypothetical protein